MPTTNKQQPETKAERDQRLRNEYARAYPHKSIGATWPHIGYVRRKLMERNNEASS